MWRRSVCCQEKINKSQNKAYFRAFCELRIIRGALRKDRFSYMGRLWPVCDTVQLHKECSEVSGQHADYPWNQRDRTRRFDSKVLS